MADQDNTRIENACWRFDIAAALDLLVGGEPVDDPAWYRGRQDQALEAVRILDVNDEAIRLFGLAGDRERLLALPIASLWPEQSRALLMSRHPVGRFGRSEEVAAAVLYLCSPEASFITGVALPLDGGFAA